MSNRTTLLSEFPDNTSGEITPSDCRDIINSAILPQDLTAGTNITVDVSSLPAITINVSGLATVASTGAYGDLSGAPSLATVATSGSYGDLSGLPALNPVATDTYITSDGGGDIIVYTISSDEGWIFSDTLGNLQGTSFIAQAYTVNTLPAFKVISAYPDYATTFTVDGSGNLVAATANFDGGYVFTDGAGNLTTNSLKITGGGAALINSDGSAKFANNHLGIDANGGIGLADYSSYGSQPVEGTLAYDFSGHVPVISDGSNWYPITLGTHY